LFFNKLFFVSLIFLFKQKFNLIFFFFLERELFDFWTPTSVFKKLLFFKEIAGISLFK